MQFSCYIEVNIICLILLGIFLYRLYLRRSMLSSADKIMIRLLIATGILCLADIVAIVSRGRMFAGARWIIEISNIIYFAAMPLISMLWCDYSREKLNISIPGKLLLPYRLPCLLFMIALFLNPLHHFFFSVNAENLYVRGPGVFLHWIVSWFYFIVAGLNALKGMRSSANTLQRHVYTPFLSFLILPAVACVAQMLLYGVTTVQVGICLSLVLVSFQNLDNSISYDELTGINNRIAMRRYVDTLIHDDDHPVVSVWMLDVNHFKQINDSYGHVMGDQALRDVAVALRSVCEKASDPLFLCRYGGDEFLIIGPETTDVGVDPIVEAIRQAVVLQSVTARRPYSLGVSIGYARGECSKKEDFEILLRDADSHMYTDKNQNR